MANVTIKLKNRSFTLECSEGERGRVEESAEALKTLFESLVSSAPNATMEHLLVLAAVILHSEAQKNVSSHGSRTHGSIEDEAVEQSLIASLKKIKDITDSISQTIKLR